MKLSPLLIALLLSLSLLSPLSAKQKPNAQFAVLEAQILEKFQRIDASHNDSISLLLHKDVESLLKELVSLPGSYTYKFDSLQRVGRRYAPRKAFCMYSWNHSMRDGTHRYFGMVVVPNKEDKKEGRNQVIVLQALEDSLPKIEEQILDNTRWFPALYYKIIKGHRCKDGGTYYTLLGFDLHDVKTKRKIIELMRINNDATITFGGPFIEHNGWTRSRLVFEYNAERYMYLEYNKWRRRIEFDHLAPLMPYLVGEYAYYEPDQFRDGLVFRSKRWKHKKDIALPPKDKKLKKRNLPKAPPINLKKVSSPTPTTPPEDIEDSEDINTSSPDNIEVPLSSTPQ